LLICLTAACATTEPLPDSTTAPENVLPLETSTPQPPLTLTAPPPVEYTGLCAETFPLENWLQISMRLVSDFQTALNSAGGLPATQVYELTLTMSALHNAAAAIPTPDCAAATQVILLDTFSQALVPFQAYSNGEPADITPTINQVNGLLEVVKTQQNQLLEQLNAQFAGG
jgi:hypothetical protein